MYMFVAIVQAILHYLGILGIALGVIAYLFGNHSRGSELLIGGVSFIVLKYIIGFIYLVLRKLFSKSQLAEKPQ